MLVDVGRKQTNDWNSARIGSKRNQQQQQQQMCFQFCLKMFSDGLLSWYDTIRYGYDTIIFTCAQQVAGNQINLSHKTKKKKIMKRTKNKHRYSSEKKRSK